jgi:hypothetical protein
MPLSALVDDTLVCAPLLPDDRWAEMRGRDIRLQPCGHPGFPRVSPAGTRHFVHVRDSGCAHQESPEHLHLKALIATAVSLAGWKAATEVAGDGYVADVLAEGSGAAVALEVQRSSQVLREYERRQGVYDQQGVRCVWFAARVPQGHRAGPGLPLFLVRDWLSEPQCAVAGRDVPLNGLVVALLTGACRWRESVPSRQATIETLRQVCPVCASERTAEVARWLQGSCTCGLPVMYADGGVTWSGGRRCCGHWGPMLTMGATIAHQPSDAALPAGHWCLSSSGPRPRPERHG